MRGEPSCPKCGGRVRAPGLFADSWQCDVHGIVHPMQPVIPPSVEALGVVVNRAEVPVWMPWPLPVGWLFTGVACADARAHYLPMKGQKVGPRGAGDRHPLAGDTQVRRWRREQLLAMGFSLPASRGSPRPRPSWASYGPSSPAAARTRPCVESSSRRSRRRLLTGGNASSE